MKSNVRRDMEEEAIVGEFLDLYFYSRIKMKCDRVDYDKTPELQEKGVDIIVTKNGTLSFVKWNSPEL
jgi:hypothetical protein